MFLKYDLESVTGNNTKKFNEEAIITLFHHVMFSWPSMLHMSICGILPQIYAPRTWNIANIFIYCIRSEGHCGSFPHVHCMFLPHSTVVYHSTNQSSNNEWSNAGNRDYMAVIVVISIPWILSLQLLQPPTKPGKLDRDFFCKYCSLELCYVTKDVILPEWWLQ